MWAAARLQYYFWTTILCQPKLRSLPKPSTMASETNSSCYQENMDAMYYLTHGTYRPTPPDHPTQHGSPTFCRSCHGPIICSHHVIFTVQKCICVVFCLSFPIDFGTTCDKSEWVSFWSRESIVFKSRKTVSHEYFTRYVYKQVMHVNFILCHGPRICPHHIILQPKGTTCDKSEWVSFWLLESIIFK